MAHYLITGGCGFIGSHLADALVFADHRVRILDDLSTGKQDFAPAGAELVVGDVADRHTVDNAIRGVDGVFHLAAIASVQRCTEDWAGAHRVNLGGAIHVFDVARTARNGAPVPVAYASSAAVYGGNPDTPLAETARPEPLSAYGADKLGCELHARVATQVFGVPTMGLRFFNVYGPRQDPTSPYSGVISIFAQRVMAGETLTIYGDGNQVRDFIYVGDVVKALVAAMAALADAARPEAQIYNVCTGRATSIRNLAEMIGALNGRPACLTFMPPRVGDIRVSIGNGGRASRALGLRETTELREGLAVTLAALRKNA